MALRVVTGRLLRAEIELPRSKSIANRAMIIGALAGAPMDEAAAATCDDTRAVAQALGGGTRLDIGAAGTAMRFLTAYLATREGRFTLTGSERMRHRPIGPLVDALRALGADIAYEGEEGFPPLRITGGALEGGEVSMEADVSSQYISALLMIAPTLRRGLTLHLTGRIASRPYIDMTLALMRRQGAEAEWTDERTLRVRPVAYRPTPYIIERDWSAASYWYEMVALTADAGARVVLRGLKEESLQGDSAVRHIYAHLGVATTFTSEGAVLTKGGQVDDPFAWDFTSTPDLAQAVCVTCALLPVAYRLTGVESLRIKETDRIAALQTELGKITGGAGMERGLSSPRIAVRGQESPRSMPVPSVIATYSDHRMAMSFAPVCLRTGEITIQDPEVVSKSYPTYWDDLRRAGFTLTES